MTNGSKNPRAERLAEALRANLRRRKAQARASHPAGREQGIKADDDKKAD